MGSVPFAKLNAPNGGKAPQTPDRRDVPYQAGSLGSTKTGGDKAGSTSSRMRSFIKRNKSQILDAARNVPGNPASRGGIGGR